MRYLLGHILLVVISCSLYAQHVSSTSSEKKEAIYYAIKEANQTLFTGESLRLDLLKNQTKHIPDLAVWIYSDWHPYDDSLTYLQCLSSFNMQANDDRLPISFVLLQKDRLVAVMTLKDETAQELSGFPNGALWVGIHVTPMEMSDRIYTKLLQFAQIAAAKLGYPEMFVYLSDPLLVDSYVHKGFQVVEKRPFHGHEITILRIP